MPLGGHHRSTFLVVCWAGSCAVSFGAEPRHGAQTRPRRPPAAAAATSKRQRRRAREAEAEVRRDRHNLPHLKRARVARVAVERALVDALPVRQGGGHGGGGTAASGARRCHRRRGARALGRHNRRKKRPRETKQRERKGAKETKQRPPPGRWTRSGSSRTP